MSIVDSFEGSSSDDRYYVLKLFVTGSTSRSARAITAIKDLCEQHLHGKYELHVVDIYQQPEAAKEAQLLAAPTLIKELPQPLRRIIGDMSDEKRVLVALDIRT